MFLCRRRIRLNDVCHAACGLALALLLQTTSLYGGERVDYDRQIRPLLADRCFACHGPDEAQRQGGFRLDQLQTAMGAADSGEKPIVPGVPEASGIVMRITSDDEDLRMPPSSSTKSLNGDEIELIRRWIAEGAQSQAHWSFIPPSRPALPEIKKRDWPKQPLDYFILSRLEAEQLETSPAADRITLIRRVTFDLTGLPPTLAEVEAFLGDSSPEAYEKVVDRLLASPRYGEHMARFWLDAARYGDTHGLHLDNYREIWPYRDWVINAFNHNLPYDQFIIEQVAGDLLPGATVDQIVATGFNRCNVSTNEGGSIAEEVHVRNVVDRVVTFGTVFMGMTFECSRCHDHKFDPFTMDDFYSLFAYFNSIDGEPLDGNRKDHAPVIKVPTPEQSRQLKELDRSIAQLEDQLRGPWPELDAAQQKWEQEMADSLSNADNETARLELGDWYTVGPFHDNRHYLTRKSHGPEGSRVALDEEFRLPTGEMLKWTRRPEWVDGKTHRGLPGELAANFLYRTIKVGAATEINVSLGSGDGVKVYLNEKQILNQDVTREAAADQESLTLSLNRGENRLLIKVMNYSGGSGFYFRVAGQQSAIPSGIIELARVARSERSPAQQNELRDYYRYQVADSQDFHAVAVELAQRRAARAGVERTVPTSLVWREAAEARPAHYLTRGQYDQPGKQVTRRTPSSLPPMAEGLANDRLGLARWMVDARHPLTARVAVNRIWLQLFGTGLVKTAEDFGSQGEPPSHPKLLDWLAIEFTADDWNVKQLVKRFVTSATYRQSSRVTPEGFRRDPENRLLARGPRFRLDAEMLRDQALFVGGLLVEKIGGPSVKPPQPDGLWHAVGYSDSNTVRFVADKGSDRVHRRSLYTFIKRTSPPPQMTTLDSPSREACVMRRERTNSPMQSLLLLNEPQFVEAARALAQRAMHAGESVSARAAYMFQVATSRRPTEQEAEELARGFAEDLAEFRSNPEAARKLVAVGEEPHDASLDVTELAAWTITASTLLNLDVVLTKN